MNPRAGQFALGGTLTAGPSSSSFDRTRRRAAALLRGPGATHPEPLRRAADRARRCRGPPPSSRTRSRCCPCRPSPAPPARGRSCCTAPRCACWRATGGWAGAPTPPRCGALPGGPSGPEPVDDVAAMGEFWVELHRRVLADLPQVPGAVVVSHAELLAAGRRGIDRLRRGARARSRDASRCRHRVRGGRQAHPAARLRPDRAGGRRRLAHARRRRGGGAAAGDDGTRWPPGSTPCGNGSARTPTSAEGDQDVTAAQLHLHRPRQGRLVLAARGADRPPAGVHARGQGPLLLRPLLRQGRRLVPAALRRRPGPSTGSSARSARTTCPTPRRRSASRSPSDRRRFMVTLRDPADRAFSSYLYMLKHGETAGHLRRGAATADPSCSSTAGTARRCSATSSASARQRPRRGLRRPGGRPAGVHRRPARPGSASSRWSSTRSCSGPGCPPAGPVAAARPGRPLGRGGRAQGRRRQPRRPGQALARRPAGALPRAGRRQAGDDRRGAPGRARRARRRPRAARRPPRHRSGAAAGAGRRAPCARGPRERRHPGSHRRAGPRRTGPGRGIVHGPHVRAGVAAEAAPARVPAVVGARPGELHLPDRRRA